MTVCGGEPLAGVPLCTTFLQICNNTNPSADHILGEWSGYHTGKGEKLTCSQAETGQAIKSAVAYFPSISCVAS